jgi:hypothetical protein
VGSGALLITDGVAVTMMVVILGEPTTVTVAAEVTTNRLVECGGRGRAGEGLPGGHTGAGKSRAK